MRAPVTAVALAGALGLSCAHLGDAVEAACIKGRLSAEQAQAINELAWEKAPNYCAGRLYTDDEGSLRAGRADCEAREGDRIFSASCSQALRSLSTGD